MALKYGLGNSKYAVILDPLHTGHMTWSMCSELLAFNMGKCKFEALYLRNDARCKVHGHNGPPIGSRPPRVEWSASSSFYHSWS